MTVIASIVLGSNGAASLRGGSQGLSTPADRTRFLERHRSASAFIIGKKSAAIESYAKSRVPIFVLTRSSEKLDLTHPLMEQVTVNENLAEAICRISQSIPGNIVVEAGPSLLLALVEAGAIELLELSISPINGDGDFISIENLLSHFEIVGEEEVDGTRLLQCRDKSDATNC
jgi:riboflavin biosynthesis pyrimidine reductase